VARRSAKPRMRTIDDDDRVRLGPAERVHDHFDDHTALDSGASQGLRIRSYGPGEQLRRLFDPRHAPRLTPIRARCGPLGTGGVHGAPPLRGIEKRPAIDRREADRTAGGKVEYGWPWIRRSVR